MTAPMPTPPSPAEIRALFVAASKARKAGEDAGEVDAALQARVGKTFEQIGAELQAGNVQDLKGFSANVLKGGTFGVANLIPAVRESANEFAGRQPVGAVIADVAGSVAAPGAMFSNLVKVAKGASPLARSLNLLPSLTAMGAVEGGTRAEPGSRTKGALIGAATAAPFAAFPMLAALASEAPGAARLARMGRKAVKADRVPMAPTGPVVPPTPITQAAGTEAEVPTYRRRARETARERAGSVRGPLLPQTLADDLEAQLRNSLGQPVRNLTGAPREVGDMVAEHLQKLGHSPEQVSQVLGTVGKSPIKGLTLDAFKDIQGTMGKLLDAGADLKAAVRAIEGQLGRKLTDAERGSLPGFTIYGGNIQR